MKGPGHTSHLANMHFQEEDVNWNQKSQLWLITESFKRPYLALEGEVIHKLIRNNLKLLRGHNFKR